ncbi:MAG: bifunctional adenosylcobinamide kinase/adenosylcobinamide-phosphate guanylyltransferase [Candidatus Nanopelagicales bacterium]
MRARTSALIGGTLLIDPGPDAGAGGVDLSSVRTVLITHDHPDHLDPAFLLAWSWAGGPSLVVAGPEQAVARCRDWVAPDAPVTFQAMSAGDELATPAGQRVRALPAAHATSGGQEYDGTALLYEVHDDQSALLYATDTAALPHGDLTGPYDLVLLELTFGDVTDHGTAHLDLPSFGHEVARLRAEHRLAPGARVVAVHLSHHNPIDLADRLAVVGAQVLPDGSSLQLGPHPTLGRSLLVTGGARSGKSQYAESVVTGRPSVTYVATAASSPHDADLAARIAAHQARRPTEWALIETADLPSALSDEAPADTLLIDCLTLWLTGVVDRADAWADPAAAGQAVQAAVEDLLDALARTRADVVLVTNEVGSGIVPATASGRLFRDLLGRVNLAVARACDDVVLVTAGLPRSLKGRTWTTWS